MNKVHNINELPKVYKKIYNEFLKEIGNRNCSKARKLIRPILEYYTANNYEIPPDIEMRYAQLYVLELQEEENKN